jgi:hypothetical protein
MAAALAGLTVSMSYAIPLTTREFGLATPCMRVPTSRCHYGTSDAQPSSNDPPKVAMIWEIPRSCVVRSQK